MNSGPGWIKFRDYKEKMGCFDCGKKYPHYILEFDHIDGSKKIDNVYRVFKKYGEDKAWTEARKCQVVCANCHKARTFIREERLGES